MMVAEVSTRWVAYGKVSLVLARTSWIRADATEIPNDNLECTGSIAGRFLFPDAHPGLYQTMLGRHKR